MCFLWMSVQIISILHQCTNCVINKKDIKSRKIITRKKVVFVFLILCCFGKTEVICFFLSHETTLTNKTVRANEYSFLLLFFYVFWTSCYFSVLLQHIWTNIALISLKWMLAVVFFPCIESLVMFHFVLNWADFLLVIMLLMLVRWLR